MRARVDGVRHLFPAADHSFDPTLPGLFAGDLPAEFVPLLEEMAADVRPESMRTALLVMAEADQRDLLPRIAVPTLLIWGELDARSPLTVARQFEEAIPDAKLVVIPGAGHVSNLEQPELFNDAVREFCRAHPPHSPETQGARATGHPYGLRLLSRPGSLLASRARRPTWTRWISRHRQARHRSLSRRKAAVAAVPP